MTLDLAALAKLEALEKEATEQPWNEFRFLRSSRADALFIEAIRNAAPELLALAREAMAARQWLKAYEPGTGVTGTYDVTGVNKARDAYRALVAANSGGT